MTLDAPKTRKKSPTPYLIGLVLLLIGVGYMIWGNMNSNLVFFVTPSEYKLDQTKYQDRLVRLGGLVKAKSSVYNRDTLNLNFVITDGSQDYPVQYQGAIPDLFAAGRGVVVEGKMQNGTFIGQNLLVKHSEEYKAPKAGEKIDVRKLLEDTQ